MAQETCRSSCVICNDEAEIMCPNDGCDATLCDDIECQLQHADECLLGTRNKEYDDSDSISDQEKRRS